MKNNVKILRGKEGPRGLPGLSAYGLWLQQGNQGDINSFFSSIGASREVLCLHSGGQCIAPGASVFLHRMTGQFKPGRYIVQFMLCADEGIFALVVDGAEPSHARYCAQGVLHGLCVVHIMQDNAAVSIQNSSNRSVQLYGHHGCVDAFIWGRPLD